ncbi:Protein of unknown function, partial [Cotesia congregata]
MPWSQYPDKSDFTKLPEQFSDRLNGQFFKRKFRGNNCPRWQSLIILRQRISTSKLDDVATGETRSGSSILLPKSEKSASSLLEPRLSKDKLTSLSMEEILSRVSDFLIGAEFEIYLQKYWVGPVIDLLKNLYKKYVKDVVCHKDNIKVGNITIICIPSNFWNNYNLRVLMTANESDARMSCYNTGYIKQSSGKRLRRNSRTID